MDQIIFQNKVNERVRGEIGQLVIDKIMLGVQVGTATQQIAALKAAAETANAGDPREP